MHNSDEKNNAAQATGGNQGNDLFVADKVDHSLIKDQNQSQVENCPIQDIEVAGQFLTLLDEDAEFFTFQTFDDTKRKNPKLARILHGTLEQHFQELCQLQKMGAGVFVTANETNGKGRKTENIIRVRVAFVDLDGSPLEPVTKSSLTPHIIIQSSPGKYHAYWVIEGLSLKDFSRVQKALIARFDSDPQVHDLPRVMRLPGFIHQKGKAFQTQILETSGEVPLKADHFLEGFNIKGEDVEVIEDPILSLLKKRRMVKSKDNHPGTFRIICPNQKEHSKDDLGTKFYLAGYNGYTKPGFQCFHDHCKDLTLHDLTRYLYGNESIKDLGNWPEPKPIKAELHSVAPFNPEALLPPVLRDWVMDESNRMPCPPDFIAAAVLVELGTVIGARCAIKPKSKDDWVVVSNLWGGVVGLPSAKKSPAISVAMKPLDRLSKQAIEDHERRSGDYEISEMVYEAKKKSIKDQLKQAAKEKTDELINALAQELQFHQQQVPNLPILRRYKSNDTTVEKLGELLRDNPYGILILRDELVGLLASWEKDGREGDRAFFLESSNGTSSFDTDRIKRGSIFIPNLCISIFGGIQPDKLTLYLEQASNALGNDGMLQRFQLLVYPDHCKWDWCNRQPLTIEKVLSLFESLAHFDPVVWGAVPKDDHNKFPFFCFDDEAQELFIQWSKELHQKKIPIEESALIAQHLSKYDKLYPALALIFHLVDCSFDGYRALVNRTAAIRAAAWCEYLETHARRCYGLLADEGLRSTQALAEKIKQGKLSDGFTARDVRRNQWRYLTKKYSVLAALEWLEDENWLRAHEVGGTGPGTGRRTKRYSINPKI